MSVQTGNKSTMLVMIIAIIALVAIVAYAMNHRAPRTTGEKVSDAANSISDGFRDAGRSLENRTPGEKVGDAVKDTGEEIKRATK